MSLAAWWGADTSLIPASIFDLQWWICFQSPVVGRIREEDFSIWYQQGDTALPNRKRKECHHEELLQQIKSSKRSLTMLFDWYVIFLLRKKKCYRRSCTGQNLSLDLIGYRLKKKSMEVWIADLEERLPLEFSNLPKLSVVLNPEPSCS